MEEVTTIDTDARLKDLTALKRKLIYGGVDIIDMSMINPDILPSTFVIDKLHEFTIKPFNHRYAVSRGVRKLREAFAEKYKRRFGVQVDPDREVCVTAGTKDGILHTLLAVTQPGDTILVGVPTYPAYLSAASFARVKVRHFEICADELVMISHIENALRTTGARVLLLNFPHNPTGQTVSVNFYRLLAEIAAQYDVTIINDFVYGEMGYGSQPVSLLSMSSHYGRVVETYSLSKAYSVPGWRVGAVSGQREIVEEISRLKSLSDYGLFLPLQLAAATVLNAKQDLVSPVLNQYSRRMHFAVSELHRIGWDAVSADAGVCLWVELPQGLRALGGTEVCRVLLESHHVLLSPGATYGAGCDGSVRIALVQPEDKLSEIFKRLDAFTQDHINH